MKKYLVVGFPKENTVEVIPSKWHIDENTCYWPLGSEASNLEAIIAKCTSPIKTWSRYHMKIYGGSNSFFRANSKVEESRYLSNLDSSDDIQSRKRIIKTPFRYRNEKDEEEESQSLLSQKTKELKIKNKKASQNVYTLPKPPEVKAVSTECEIVHPAQSQKLEQEGLHDSLSEFLRTPGETIFEKILKHLVEIKNVNKAIKSELRRLREKVELKLQVDENPQVAAVISNIVLEEFPTLPLTSITDLQNLNSEVTRDAAKATSLLV